MPTSTLTSKGQITLPREVRDYLRLVEGDRVEFVIEEGGVVRVRPVSGSVRDLFGCISRPRQPSPGLEDLEEELMRSLSAEDLRIREGRE